MFRKTYFEEIWYCSEFYIGGINVLSAANRKFVKLVDINLSGYSQNHPYKYIKEAKLYKTSINHRTFKFAIAEIEKDIVIIAYLSRYSFIQSVEANNDASRRLNKESLYNLALTYTPKEQSDDDFVYIYSPNNSVRMRIAKDKTCIKVQKQIFCLNPDATIYIPSDLRKNPYEFLGWYENDDSGVSVYDSVDEALKNISLQ